MVRSCTTLCVLVTLLVSAGPLVAAEPEIVSIAKIWDRGKHNAFTDLIRFHDIFLS